MRYVFGVLVMLVCAGAAWGETITVLSAGAFRAVIETSGGAYTQATGDRIAITSDTAGGGGAAVARVVAGAGDGGRAGGQGDAAGAIRPGQTARAATPGKVLPSSHSRKAPPAVET